MTKEQLVEALRKNADENTCQFACGECDESDCLTPVFRAAADLIEEQAEKIKELEANVPRWIPCSERVPELPNGRRCNRAVIVCVRGHVMPLIYERSIVRGKTVERWKWMWDRIYDDPESITHWMPLPEAPEVE